MALGDMIQVLEGLGSVDTRQEPEQYRYGAFAQPSRYAARLAGVGQLDGLAGYSGSQKLGAVAAVGLVLLLGYRWREGRAIRAGTQEAQMREFLRKTERAGSSYGTSRRGRTGY